MRRSTRRKDFFSFLFARPKAEQYLAQYVLREHARGRPLAEVLDDAYVRNRATAEARARLLERPEVVTAVGRQAVTDLRRTLAGAPR